MGRDPDSGWDDEKERRDQASAEAQRRDEMTIDYSKIKPGDVVGVRVIGVEADGVVLQHSAWIPHGAIVSHTPAPRPALKVGDRVRVPHIPGELLVIWIARGKAWLEPSANHVPYYPLSEVEQWERV